MSKSTRICNICHENTVIPRYTFCNQCNLKKKKTDNNKKYCSCCSNEIFDNVNNDTNMCKKCIDKGVKERELIHEINDKCIWFDVDNDIKVCENEIYKNFYCEKHYSCFVEMTKKIILNEDKNMYNQADNEYKMTNIDEYVEDREELIKSIMKIKNWSAERLTKSNKNEEIEEFKKQKMFTDDAYKEYIFNTNEWTIEMIDKLDLDLEIISRKEDCKNLIDKQKCDLLNNLWEYFRIHTSSIRTNRAPGRIIKGMIIDKNTKKYLGIFAINNAMYSIEAIDKHIGWTNEDKKKYIGTHIMNISCCVGLRPSCFNLNIGKLITMAMFSKEIQDEFKKRYGNYIAAIMTFSIYGKSVQYDRLKCVKLLKECDGLTKGHSCDLPNDIFEKGMIYLKNIGYTLKKTNSIFGLGRLRKIRILCKELNIDVHDLYNDEKRGVYFGYTNKNSKDLLCNKLNDIQNFVPEMKTFEEIVIEWKERWAKQRLTHLINTNRVKKEYELFEYLTRKEKLKLYIKTHKEKIIQSMGIRNYNSLMSEYRKERYIIEKYNEKIDINILDTNDYFNVELSASYLGGLFDGDGSFFIYKSKKDNGYSLSINFFQNVVNILKILQINFGGYIYKQNKKENQRQQYCWKINGIYSKKIIDKLVTGCIIKKDQALYAQEFLTLINTNNTDRKLELYNNIRACNARIVDEEKRNKPYDNINIDYITGIFDAEGCVLINKSYNKHYIKITQKNDVKILEYIKNYVKMGKVDEYVWISYHKDIINFAKDMFKISIIKKKQLHAYIKYLETMNKKFVGNKTIIRENCYDIIQNEKHTSIELEEEIIGICNDIASTDNKKDNIFEKSIEHQMYNERLKIQRKLHKQQNIETKEIKEISENTKTSNEDVLKFSFSEEHRKKIAMANMKNRRLLSDDKIREVLSLLKNKKPRKDIASDFNVSRQMIDDIANGNLLPIDEITKEDFNKLFEMKQNKKLKNQNKSDEEKINDKNKDTSINKRTLDVKTIIEILLLKNVVGKGNMKYNPSAPKVVKMYKEKNIKITPTIIKNIWSGKTKIFEEEFIDLQITYEKYLEIVNKN